LISQPSLPGGRTAPTPSGPCAHSLTFVIDGPLMGYRKDVAYSHSEKYKAYKTYIRYRLLAAGIARAPKWIDDVIPKLSVAIQWKKKARIDWDNVVKAVSDAIWKNDRNVDPDLFMVIRNSGKPESALVTIRWVK
jgi:Endodeoxyribonuclease RusA